MRNDRLLAKSCNKNSTQNSFDNEIDVRQHLDQVFKTSEIILNTCCKYIFYACNIEYSDHNIDFVRGVIKLSTLLHDIGKTNSQFQKMLRREIRQQDVRHEFISCYIINLPEFKSWLSEKFTEEQIMLAQFSILGHHRKYGDRNNDSKEDDITIPFEHKDFINVLNLIKQECNITGNIPRLKDRTFKHVVKSKNELSISRDLIGAIKLPMHKLGKLIKKTNKQYIFYNAICKIVTIIADCIGSRFGTTISSELVFKDQKSLSGDDFDFIFHNWVVKNNLPNNFELRDFQKNIAASTAKITLVEAGCGSGKSIAAYCWAKQYAEQYKKESRPFNMIFCSPTTGTTTENYADYIFNIKSTIPSKLLHSRSVIDEEWLNNYEQDENDDNSIDYDDLNNREHMLSLNSPLVVTTADTILGLLIFRLLSIMFFVKIINSAIVFDEIHSYDDSMFELLLVFMDKFKNIPILLMSASLPQYRRDAILKVRSDLNIIAGPYELEVIKRYKIQLSTIKSFDWSILAKYVNNNGKVLIIKNTVNDANNLYTNLVNIYGSKCVKLYHSRYKYKDRAKLHRHIIDLFKNKNHPVILIATQVAEMALDLNSTLLITDLAPIPSLIQRMGRLNRRATKDDLWDCFVLIDQVISGYKNCLPYTEEELKLSNVWLNELLKYDNGISQKDLIIETNKLNITCEKHVDMSKKRAILFELVEETYQGDVRIPGYTIPVLLESDFVANKEKQFTPSQLKNWIRTHEVPILRPKNETVLQTGNINGKRVIFAPTNVVDYDFDYDNISGIGAVLCEK